MEMMLMRLGRCTLSTGCIRATPAGESKAYFSADDAGTGWWAEGNASERPALVVPPTASQRASSSVCLMASTPITQQCLGRAGHLWRSISSLAAWIDGDLHFAYSWSLFMGTSLA